MTSPERQLEEQLIEKLCGLKRESFDHVHLTDCKFERLLDDVFTADHSLRNFSRAQSASTERMRECSWLHP